MEHLDMQVREFEEIKGTEIHSVEAVSEFEDLSIPCIDCAQQFIWTGGEQAFFRDKQLLNPPKRCKDCKKAKNVRLEAIENAKVTGQRHRIEVNADCARCGKNTTVPFYPCQGRPVYCRGCYSEISSKAAASTFTP